VTLATARPGFVSIIGIAAALWAGVGYRYLCDVQAQGPPPIYAYGTIYSLQHGHWHATNVLRLGDRVRFVLRFKSELFGSAGLRGRLTVRRERTPQYNAPVVYQGPLKSTRTAHGFTRFWLNTRITGRGWIGRRVAEFDITGVGGQKAETGVLFSVA